MQKILLLTILFMQFATLSFAAIHTEEVEYSSGDTKMKGYLAYDDSLEGKRPGILVVHEWWGHNEHARNSARKLAEIGYVALAVDMYGDGKMADHPETAGEFSSAVSKNMMGVGLPRFMEAMKVLQTNPLVDGDKIGAIGYCFGGGTVLHMARFGVPLKGVVSFHGSLGTQTPAEPGAVKAKILVCHGAADGFISEEQIAAFKEEMEHAGADYKFVEYEGATHSFTNPKADELAEKFDMPVAYNAQADQKSWADMTQFWEGIFYGHEE